MAPDTLARVWHWRGGPRRLPARRRDALKRAVVAELLGVDARRVRLGRAASGAPIARVPGRGRVWLSASDTRGGYAVAASVTGPVGIDIERPRGRRVAADQPWLHPRERAAIAAAGDARREAVFLGIWTQKEAVLKLDGSGLGARLAGFAVEVDPARPARCDAASRPCLRRVRAAGLAAALATRSRRPVVVDALRIRPSATVARAGAIGIG